MYICLCSTDDLADLCRLNKCYIVGHDFIDYDLGNLR